MSSMSKALKASFETVPDMGDFFLNRLSGINWRSNRLMYAREHGSLTRGAWEHRTVIAKIKVAVRDTVLGTNLFLHAMLQPDSGEWDALWQKVA